LVKTRPGDQEDERTSEVKVGQNGRHEIPWRETREAIQNLSRWECECFREI